MAAQAEASLSAAGEPSPDPGGGVLRLPARLTEPSDSFLGPAEQGSSTESAQAHVIRLTVYDEAVGVRARAMTARREEPGRAPFSGWRFPCSFSMA
jgi:hypothetical protein